MPNEKKLLTKSKCCDMLFENMLDGCAYCRMIYDEAGHPVDFIYLDINPAFEELTGLKGVAGKAVSEIIPTIREEHPDLLEIYGRVASTGKPEKFEYYFKPLSTWFYLSVYSPEKDHFVAVFNNISEYKKTIEALNERNDELEKINEMTTDRELKMIEMKAKIKLLEEKLALAEKA